MPPPLLLSNGLGRVAEVNDAAARLLGPGRGLPCNEVVRARDADGLPVCSATCAGALVHSATATRDRPSVRIRDRWWNLVCTPMGAVAAVQMFEVAPPAHPGAALTARERQVLDLVAEGLTTAQIAAQLQIRPATVRTHVEHVRHKLGARTRAEAVAKRAAQN